MTCFALALPELRQDFPRYDFVVSNTWRGLGIVAIRREPGDGPYLVISEDVAELRSILSQPCMHPSMPGQTG